MILFSTSYDSATIANLTVAQKILKKNDIQLFSESAIRENLISRIKSLEKEQFLYIMSHGNQDKIIDNNKVPALISEEASLLKNWRVFAWACKTSNDLGYKVAEKRGTWLGYNSIITAPESIEPLLSWFVDLFAYIKDNFINIETNIEAETFLNKLKDMCDALISKIDAYFAEDIDTNMIQVYMCVRNVWDRLNIHLSGLPDPIKHPESSPPILDYL